MANIPVRWLLFFSSYIPLMLVFCVLLVANQPLWALGVFIYSLFVFTVMLIYFFRLAPSVTADPPVKVRELHGRDSDAMSYMATYLLPFVVFPLQGWQQILALAIVAFVLGFVYVNSNMIYINPMLNLVGFHLYDVAVEHDEKHYSLIVHRRITYGETLHPITLGDGILMDKGVKIK
jgi:hypothetical protein